MNKPIVMRFCIAKQLPNDMKASDYLRILDEHEAANLVKLDQIRIGQQTQQLDQPFLQSHMQGGVQNPFGQLSAVQNATAIDFFRLPETLAR